MAHSKRIPTHLLLVVVLALGVDGLQLDRPAHVTGGHDLDEPLQLGFEVLALSVEPPEQGVDGVEVGPQTRVEVPQVVFADLRLEPVENAVEQRVRDLFVHGSSQPDQPVAIAR